VDDEELARERLRLLVGKYAETRLGGANALRVEEAVDGIDAIERIRTLTPDVVLLDIQMPEVGGFDVLFQFPQRTFEIVFQTAYGEYALKAFEVAAVDYLLKPFTPERLYEALDRALARCAARRATGSAGAAGAPGAPGASDELGPDSALVASLREQRIHLDHLAVRVGSRVRMVPVNEIQYFLSEDHVTTLFTRDTSYACDPSLSALEERLDPRGFLRIHRNAIVNLREISSFTLESNASLTLRSGVTLKVSRERKKELKALIGDGG
jgi:two-component system LytT family response regulator